MRFRIVPATEAHLPKIAALEKICFPADPWSEELFQAGSILGYTVLSVILDEGNLDNIAVAPEARRRGVADALLSVLTGFGRDNLAVLMLEVRASNTPAIALYEKHGFAAVGRRKNYYEAPKEDAVLMTLTF